ncbi:MAG: ATP-dependent DNA helicase RecG [Gammaproteobacteria bacterium]|nr:ATP-dependent DNA helicase RecG [Gammaproteobacteria bacterium]
MRSLKRVGPSVAEKLARLNIFTIQDLLFHLPLRYQDRTRVVPIGSLRSGAEAVIEAEVLLTDIKYGRRRMLLSRIGDRTGFITLRFFHFNASQQQALSPGAKIRCFGEVRYSGQGLEMVHPEYELLKSDAIPVVNHSPAHLTPVYPATEGLRQFSLRALIDQLVLDSNTLQVDVPEWLPSSCLQHLKFPPLAQAIAFVHKPPPDAPVNELLSGQHRCQQRLAFEELLAHHLSMRRRRLRYQQHQAPVFNQECQLANQLQTRLPFALTGAQQRVYAEIRQDLRRSLPMLRLVQGDVGCGKTIVAALSVLHAVESGCQAAVMAPTELLADQHYRSFRQWLEPLGVRVQWLSGKLKGKARESVLTEIAGGSAQVVAGTHALFQDDVSFSRLGLIVVDEQHRFGVHQRLALRNKGKSTQASIELYPHQLIMTATPIPRTLAMTTYADLDCSIIDELPPGRRPVQTVVIDDKRRPQVIERVHGACKSGQQAYWVCTLIEESEVLQCQAAEDTARQLQEELPDIRIGLVHGRMKPVDKDTVMQEFKCGSLDMLVATTVIEVGVDVPNATLMIIENAERLGLSQLHQLRGRVGRGDQQSNCVLLYRMPLSQLARQRLAVMHDSNDGFVIAQRDLEIRGPGELLGTRQTGMEQFHIADLQRDQVMLPDVIKTASELLNLDPEHIDAIIQRWLGRNEEYGNV